MDSHKNNLTQDEKEGTEYDSVSSVMSVESVPGSKFWRKRLRPRKENSGQSQNGKTGETVSSDEEVSAPKKVGKVKKSKRRLEKSDQQVAQSKPMLHETTEEKMARVLADNARLQAELADLRKEFADMRAEYCKCNCGKQPNNISAAPADRSYAKAVAGTSQTFYSTHVPPKDIAEIVQRLMAVETLLCKPRLRPPLAADSKASGSNGGLKAPKGKKGEKVAALSKDATESVQVTSLEQVPPKPSEQKWVTVGKKSKKKGNGSGQVRVPRLRTPRSTAVVIKLQAEAEKEGLTYEKILDEATAKIKLADLGIADVRYRKTATGASVLELPGTGPEHEMKANALAEELKNSFMTTSGVEVSRPMMCADVRITGLDESVTTAKLLDAVARAGECPVNQLKCSSVRKNFNGTLNGVVNCPVHVAQKLGDGRRLLVGWVSAQIKILPRRPLRCFRCMECGHAAAKCTSNVDCSNLCFRCGRAGHKSSDCTAAAHCIVCAAVNEPAEHRVGNGTACAASSRTKKKKRSEKGTKAPSGSVRSLAATARSDDVAQEMQCS